MKSTLPDSEKSVDAALGAAVKKEKGLYVKLGTMVMSGLPDRMVLLQYGEIRFVEVKSKGKNPTPLQTFTMKTLSALGFKCYVLRGGDDFFRLSEIIEGL